MTRCTTLSICISTILCTVFYFSLLSVSEGNNATSNFAGINNGELQAVTEELFRMSTDQIYKDVFIEYQGRTTSRNFSDNARNRLLNVSPRIFSIPSIRSLVKLYDNYELNVNRQEVVTKEENEEENEFISHMLSTSIMLRSLDFLADHGFFQKDLQTYKTMLKTIWFQPYSRHKGVNGSSGFEHVFLAEFKSRKGIIGLHNWVFFYINEMSEKINYFGYARHIELGGKAEVAQIYVTFARKRKISTMFIATTPELEMALYTICFFARPNQRCNISLAGKSLVIQSYTIQSGNKILVASAFPVI